MKALMLVILGLSLSLVSCGRTHSSATDSATSPPGETAHPSKNGASISASPNPVPPGRQSGETTITWDTGSGEAGEVYVSKGGGPEHLFSRGQSGSEKADWIAAHTRYEFRLYEGSTHKKLLSTVQVVPRAK